MKTDRSRIIRIAFQTLLTLTLFSFWAGFALLVINRLFYNTLPGYTIGRLCIWELIALIVAALIGQFMINAWGIPKLETIGNKERLTMNPKYGVYFFVYFVIALIVGIWQFWIFSQQF